MPNLMNPTSSSLYLMYNFFQHISLSYSFFFFSSRFLLCLIQIFVERGIISYLSEIKLKNLYKIPFNFLLASHWQIWDQVARSF